MVSWTYVGKGTEVEECRTGSVFRRLLILKVQGCIFDVPEETGPLGTQYCRSGLDSLPEIRGDENTLPFPSGYNIFSSTLPSTTAVETFYARRGLRLVPLHPSLNPGRERGKCVTLRDSSSTLDPKVWGAGAGLDEDGPVCVKVNVKFLFNEIQREVHKKKRKTEDTRDLVYFFRVNNK